MAEPNTGPTSGRSRSVIVEADGGSRGNPGNAAYGAVLRDAETGAVIAERGERIGVATNNVAEYRGLIAAMDSVRFEHVRREYNAHADRLANQAMDEAALDPTS